MNAFATHADATQSLMTFITSRNIDISTQELFTEAMRQWYICQRQVDKKIEEMPTNVLIKALKLK